ncbi:hypothetical protein BURPS1106B_A2044 [Burkholderia pseudomallei 1106b]|nr:hypothetical protein BURPSS13_V0054 [Burkholderia pseudomallei S13]EEC35949.1 hypothetical protein BUC_3080 [Burkholderia pseudomallei 576]EEH24015.1 hypothetical protein BUH_2875 [Burkholderia pseudomallei Pakistan 9]EES25304.1 hypothetical protein BURPS1106B_A2044 [Burkholderia pseudomallei 1106b]
MKVERRPRAAMARAVYGNSPSRAASPHGRAGFNRRSVDCARYRPDARAFV